MTHSRKVAEINPRDIEVHFAPAVTKAFGDLEEAVRGSKHFDGDIHRIVQDYAAGKTKTLHSVLIGLPEIAAQTMQHVRMTGDTSAEAAWDEIAVQMNEAGFSVTPARGRRR
jgi:hypothetical protein